MQKANEPVGAACLWKWRRMRPSSGSSPRSVSGACPPGMKTPLNVESSSLEMVAKGRGDSRLFSTSCCLMSLDSCSSAISSSRQNHRRKRRALSFSQKLPMNASAVDLDSGSMPGCFPLGDANWSGRRVSPVWLEGDAYALSLRIPRRESWRAASPCKQTMRCDLVEDRACAYSSMRK
jgi:hypothetical protein